MEKHYKINNHGRNRMDSKYSIDHVSADGSYIAQEAFYFKNASAARERAATIITEDAERGVTSTLFDGVGKA